MPRSNKWDEEIIQLNSLGFSLATIASKLGCHPTTVCVRLAKNNVEATDTRRTFMEDIVETFEPQHQVWLLKRLEGTSIKEYVRNLMLEDFGENQ